MTILMRDIFKKNWLPISAFLFLEMIMVLFFIYNKNSKVEEYLSSLQQTYLIQNETIEQNFDYLTQNTFYGIINKPNIIDPMKNAFSKDTQTKSHYREILYKRFLADFERLKQFQFEQVHFHFKDNTSFLRMHQPALFDDNLSTIRFGINKVNKTLKPTNGFELGRSAYGFRYIFPIFDENLFHIGSVELSVPVSYYQYNYEKIFQLDTHFLVNQSLTKNKMYPEYLNKQKVSIENDNYFVNKISKNEAIIFDKKQFYTTSELENIKQKMSEGKPFIFYKRYGGFYYSISFLNVKNIEGDPNSAYLVLYKRALYIEQIFDNFHKILFILVTIFIIFLFLIYRIYLKNLQNLHQQEILSQQTKLASMGEMIGNIAHQWRQPLTVISVASSGMKLQQEYGLLSDEKLVENLDLITRNTQYLSQTIEDFRTFFNNEKEKTPFNIKENIVQVINLFQDAFRNDNIIIIANIDDISIISYQHDFKQILINLIKNAKDAIKNDGYIIITTNKNENKIIITIQDSGGGISNEIIGKIFEPYFTTKHQSQGTGLGLYMVYELIVNNFNGTLEVENLGFDYNFTHYYGACFKITLDKNKL
ncbi:MAG: ATP-binding protein [Arcobacteraceae bacterium]|nr:ATP-binding protein [Arcobacteraceae bacterium]